MTDPIATTLTDHYDRLLDEYGDSHQSLNYSSPEVQDICFDAALGLIRDQGPHTLLDVGCGLGHLLDSIRGRGLDITYTGLDLSEKMVAAAATRHPDTEFLACDLKTLPRERRFDFITAVGVFTRKTARLTEEALKALTRETIREMYSRARCGAAFNIVTSHVEWTTEELVYHDPAEVFTFCRTELTRHIQLRHDYPLWDFTVYLYRPEYMRDVYGFYR